MKTVTLCDWDNFACIADTAVQSPFMVLLAVVVATYLACIVAETFH